MVENETEKRETMSSNVLPTPQKLEGSVAKFWGLSKSLHLLKS